VLDVDTKAKVITVAADRGGSPPAFDGTGGRVHDRVRQEMKQVLSESEPISFLDAAGASLLEEARQFFREADFDKKQLVADGNSTLLLGWRGDWTNDALSLLLTAHGLQTSNEGIALRVSSGEITRIREQLSEIAIGPTPTVEDLKLKPEHVIREKWDWALPDELRLLSFASSHLDFLAAKVSAADLVERT